MQTTTFCMRLISINSLTALVMKHVMTACVNKYIKTTNNTFIVI